MDEQEKCDEALDEAIVELRRDGVSDGEIESALRRKADEIQYIHWGGPDY